MNSSRPRWGRRAGVLAFVVLVLAGIAWFVPWPDAPGLSAPSTAPPTAPRPDAPSHAASEPLPAATKPGLTVATRWTMGQWRRYDVRWKQSLQLSVNDAPAQARNLEFDATWTLDVTDHQNDADGRLSRVLVRSVLEVSKLRTDVFPSAVATAMREAAGRPSFVAFSPEGRVEQYYFEPSVSPVARALTRALASRVQIVVPAEASDRWTTAERDVTGPYEATYLSSANGALLKRHGGYAPTDRRERASAEGEVRFQLDDAAWPVRATGLHTQRRRGTPGIPQLDAREEIAVERTGGGHRTDAVGAFARDGSGLVAVDPEDSDGSEEIQRTSKLRDAKERARGTSIESLLTALEQIPAGADGGDQRAEIAFGLVDLFRSSPAAVQEAPARIQNGLPSEAADMLLNALAAVDSPEAHQALLDVLDAVMAGEAAEGVAIELVMALASARRASPRAVRGLARLEQAATEAGTPRLANAAVLAQGGQARTLAESDPTAAAEIVEELTTRAMSAEEERERVALVAALANAGAAGVYELALPLLTSPVWDIRAAAVYAMRGAPSGPADATLSQVMRTDRHPMVRRAAVSTIPYRDPAPLLQSIAQVLRQDPEELVRGTALSLVDTQDSLLLALIEAVSQVAEHDPLPRLRSRASDMLARVAQPSDSP